MQKEATESLPARYFIGIASGVLELLEHPEKARALAEASAVRSYRHSVLSQQHEEWDFGRVLVEP